MAEAPELLTTDRFEGRRIGPHDLADFQAFYADPAVMKTLSADGRPWPPRESEDLFRRHLAHWDRHGFGTWIFRDGPGGSFVGRAGLRQVELAGADDIEVFYGVASDRWGNGVGTELAREIVRVGLEELRLPQLVAFTLPTNRASRRILEGCGFGRDGEIVHAGLRHLLFRLDGPAEAR